MEDPKNLIPQQPIIQPEVINLPKHGTPEAYAYAYAEYGFKRIAKLEEDITEAKNTGNTAGIAKAESEITKMKGMMAESLQILEKGGITIPKATTNILEKKEVTYSPLLSINLNWYAEESGGHGRRFNKEGLAMVTTGMNEEQAHIFESLLSSLADANQKSVELYVLREPPKPAIASQRYQQEHLQYRLKRSTLAAECEDSKRQVSRALKLLIERGLRVIIKDQNGEVKNNDIGAVVDDPIFKIEVEKQNS